MMILTLESDIFLNPPSPSVSLWPHYLHHCHKDSVSRMASSQITVQSRKPPRTPDLSA